MTDGTKENIKFTCINIIGSIFPIFLFYLASCFKQDSILPFNFLSDRGDFLIVGISLIISSCYTIYKLQKKKGSNGTIGTVFWISIFIIVTTTFIFGLVLSENILTCIESEIIKYFSIFIVLWCIAIVFIATYFDTLDPSVTKRRKRQGDALERSYLKLHGARG